MKNKTVIESSNSSKEEFKNKDAGIVPKLNKEPNGSRRKKVIAVIGSSLTRKIMKKPINTAAREASIIPINSI
mgnify:CR=1 FL=1